MNIFLLSLNISLLVAYHCDKHIVKMPLEITQMLYSCWSLINKDKLQDAPNGGYKQTHINHPVCIWIRTNKANYKFACQIGLALCDEYQKRYTKIHKCKEHLLWLFDNIPSITNAKKISLFPQAMPEQYHCKNPKTNQDIVDAYIRYYSFEKLKISKWNHSKDYSKKFNPKKLKKKEIINIVKFVGIDYQNKRKKDLIKLYKRYQKLMNNLSSKNMKDLKTLAYENNLIDSLTQKIKKKDLIDLLFSNL